MVWPGTISRWPPRPGGPKMRGPIAEAGGGLKNQNFIQRNEVEGSSLGPTPRSQPRILRGLKALPRRLARKPRVAKDSRGRVSGGSRGSLPHILSEYPAPGHHVCGTNPRRIVLTQGTWRLRRTVGPPSSGALSVGTVLRYSSAGRNARASTGTFDSNKSSSFFEGIKCPH